MRYVQVLLEDTEHEALSNAARASKLPLAGLMRQLVRDFIGHNPIVCAQAGATQTPGATLADALEQTPGVITQ
jgi:hypothetical protein